jgi:hypothetical protein
MPFKSKAQRRKFAQLLVEGKISDETYEEWNRETGRKKLPERVTPQKKAKKTRRRRKAKKTKGIRRLRRGRRYEVSRPRVEDRA